MIRTQIIGAAVALLAGAPALAATYTVNVGNPLDLGSVAAAPSGDTVFRINPSTGAVSVVSGTGRRIAAGAVRALVTVTCRPSRVDDGACRDNNVPIQAGVIGLITGRARALRNFSVAMGTAVQIGPSSGTSPLNFTIGPIGDNQSKTFFVGADFAVAGDDSGLASGPGENAFFVYALDQGGLSMGGDTDRGRVQAFRGLAVGKTADLDFGRIQLPTTGQSIVTLNASTGVRTVSGGGFGFPTPAPTRAAFTVTGEGGQVVSISIPASFNLSGPATLAVNVTHTAVATPRLSGAVGAAGTYGFNIGGSVTLTPTTPSGAYSGVLTLSVDYN
jgi:hypothetical protein